MDWFGNPGIINTAALLIIILMNMGCYTLNICNSNSGHSPVVLIDTGDPAEHLRQKKVAEALDTTVDFLINGNTEDKANAVLNDAEVIRYFKEVDNLPSDDKTALLRVIGGFLRDVKTKQAYAS